MNRFLEYFASHPTAANLLMLGLLMLGVLAIPNIKRETFPDFAPNNVQISVTYPGATAEDVEEAICERIEDALESLSDIEEITSRASEGVAVVIAEMTEGGNIDRFLMDVKTEVDAINDFPDAAEDPVVTQLDRLDFVMSIAVTGDMSATDLKAYCEDVKDRLIAETEITQISILGFSERQIRVEIPAQALMQYGISAADIADTIARQSLDLPAGTLETRAGDILIRFVDQRRTIREFADLIVVAGSSGAEIRLGNIARITDRFELDEDKILFNGQRAGLLQINKSKEQDALRLVKQIEDFLSKERLSAPPSVHYNITRNISEIISDRLNMLVENGIAGLVLVFLTMWLFFAFRYSFWVAMGLPVSFMGGLYGMMVTGMTINMLTMVGLLLATGLIMDDAIVISENIAAHIAKGKKAYRAVVDGTREVGAGIVASFTTTVCIFGSLAAFLQGDIGKVLWVMPVVLILTLGFSLVEAFLILPNHLSHSLNPDKLKNRTTFRRWFDTHVENVRENVVGRFADAAIRHRYVFVGCVICLFIISVGMVAGGRLKFKVFPEIEGDVLEARILLPQGTPLERTEAVAQKLIEALGKVDTELTPQQPDGKPLVENIAVYYNTNVDANEKGPHVATVSADLLSAEIRNSSITTISNLWREHTGIVPDVISLVWKEPQLGPGGSPIKMRFSGPDLDRLKAASLELQQHLATYKGVVDLSDDLRPGKPELQVTLKQGATALGITAQSIARQLRAAFFGITATEIQYNGESYEIDVRLAPEDKNSLADLSYFHITDAKGNQIPVGDLVNITSGRGWARINRVNGVRTITVEGDVHESEGNASQIRAEVVANFIPQLQKKYPGITFSQEGEAKEGAKTGASFRKAFLVGIFGIFILLSFQFKSYAEPFTVLATIPLAAIGVIWGHIFMGLNLSMPSIMGFVSLAGIVVNDSILLVEFLKMRLGEGKTPIEAAPLASRQRFRAVLLTSMTTIMGLLPLLFETSTQAQVLIPLVCSVIFGLTASTLLVLFVVPSFYTILDDLGLTRNARDRKRQQQV